MKKKKRIVFFYTAENNIFVFPIKEGEADTHIHIHDVQITGLSGTLKKTVGSIPCSATFQLYEFGT